MLPLVSILFPCYNAEKYLKYSLESILNQDYKNLEIICINDGSSDDTLAILKEYSLKDQRIVIIDNGENLGLIKSLNNSLKLINGFYFARMDADDFSEPDRISVQVDFLTKNEDVDLVGSAYNYFEKDHVKKQYVAPIATTNNALKFLSLFATPLAHPTILGKSDLIRRGKFYYDKDFIHAEDFEIFSRLLWQDCKLVNLDRPLHWLRLNPTSVSARFNDIQILTNLKIVKRNLSNLPAFKGEISAEMLRVLSNRINTIVSRKTLQDAFIILNAYYEDAKRVLALSSADTKEIDAFLVHHRLNIVLQANKFRFKYLGFKNLPFFLFNQ